MTYLEALLSEAFEAAFFGSGVFGVEGITLFGSGLTTVEARGTGGVDFTVGADWTWETAGIGVAFTSDGTGATWLGGCATGAAAVTCGFVATGGGEDSLRMT